MIGKVFLAEIHNIAKNTRSAETVRTAMKHIMKVTNSMTHSIYVVDLLKTLKKKRIGTNAIENLLAKLCGKGTGRETILEIVLKNRIAEAHKEVRRMKYENLKTWREKDDILIREGVLEAFLVVWAKEKTRYRKSLKSQQKRKVKWLCKKYQKKKEPLPEQYMGYDFKDQDMGDDFRIETVVYDNVEVSTEEEEALKLHPKFTTYEEVDKTQLMTEIEKSFTKIRWERMSKERNNEEGVAGASTSRRKDWKNIETNTIDMRNMSSTDLPFNSRVYLPEGIDEITEMEMFMLKNKLEATMEDYVKSHSNKQKNLTTEQKKGIRSLKQRRDRGEIVVFQTDKSMKMAVDSANNYIESMKTHVEKDEIISEKDHKEIERLMNAHAVFWTRFMQAGQETGDQYRIKMSMQSKNNDPACLYSLRKDHKKSMMRQEQQPDGEIVVRNEGPPVRPVCDVSDSISHKLSYLLSNIIDELCSGDTVCNSTEEMLASIEKCNERGIEEGYVLGSADVKSLYPSIPVDDAIDVVVEEFERKEICVEGIDYEELGLYLALTLEPEELEHSGIGDTCPTRAHNGRRPEITSSGMKVSKAERFDPWRRARETPNEVQKKRMFRGALKVALKVVMKNHTYEFDRVIRRQRDGGPIGMDLTGTIAKIFMKWWDGQLKLKMEAVGIVNKLYERYVDDINKFVKETAIGVRYVEGQLICTEETKREDEGKPADQRTFEVIRQIGDSIHPNIKLEVDVPSNYPDHKLPSLDLKVWIAKVRTGSREELKILHQHYIKPMANKFVIREDSAMSTKNKRSILTQMCLRVMLNNSEYLEMKDKKETVEFFMKRMQASGYKERFRYEVLRSAMNAYEKIVNDPSRPKYRGKETNTPRKRTERKKKRHNWYRVGGYESVIFVPATPNSELARRMKDVVSRSNLNINVVERAGTKIKRLLQKNDPNKSGECNADNCFVCSTTKEGSCRKSGVTYRITCKGNCGGDVYNGETHKNGYSRGGEHLSDYRFKRGHSIMWKHCEKKHGGDEQQFEMKVMDYVRGDPTKRQIMEAVRINDIPESARINDRKEWVVGKIPTVIVTDQ